MATTNLVISKIKSKQKLLQKSYHILRKGDYKDPNIIIHKNKDLSYLNNTTNRSKISSELSTYKKRVEKYKQELESLKNNNAETKKLQKKEKSILKNKAIVKELEDQLHYTINNVRPNFIEIVTLVSQAQHLKNNKLYIQALYDVTNRWLNSLNLGEVIVQATHLDQSNPHIHQIIQLPTSFSKVVEDKELSNQPYKFLQKSFNEFVLNDQEINKYIQIKKQKKHPINYLSIDEYKKKTYELNQQLQPPSLDLKESDIVYTTSILGKNKKVGITLSKFKKIKKSFDNFHNQIIDKLNQHKIVQNINESLKTEVKELEQQIFSQQKTILDFEFYKNEYKHLQSRFDNLNISFDKLKQKNKELVNQKHNIQIVNELQDLEQDISDIEFM